MREDRFTHAELGARLAERWSYPRALADAIHEHDSDAPTTQLAAVVHVADRLVRQAGIGVEPAADPAPAALELAGVASLTQARERLEPLLAAQDRFDAFQAPVRPRSALEYAPYPRFRRRLLCP